MCVLNNVFHHFMELPRWILIGENTINNLGSFISELNQSSSKLVIISGPNVKKSLEKDIVDSLNEHDYAYMWSVVEDASVNVVDSIRNDCYNFNPNFVLGLGGGRSVDIAKMLAYNLSIPSISIPTSASHDGISSPFVSLRGSNKPYSIKVNTPIAVLADVNVLSKAPMRLLSSGCGDLIGKITAVKDWELARDEKNEYFGEYAASLASLSAEIITKTERRISTRTDYIRSIIEALISAGVASCIAGSSRPCSGSEHLFSHAMEFIVGNNNCGFHGERVGIGTIMMAKLHGLDWTNIVRALEYSRAPTTAKGIGVTDKDVVKSLMIAQSLRPERYTILSKIKLDENNAYSLARSVNVI